MAVRRRGQYRCAGVVRDGRAADVVEARACPDEGATVAAVDEAPVEDGEGEERRAPVEDGEGDERRATEGNIVVAAPVEDGEGDERHTAEGDIVVAAPSAPVHSMTAE